MTYTKTSWTNSSGQPISAANLNKIETGIADAHAAKPINVADYGAVADGTTDDADAIRSAIAAAEASGAKTVIFPWGASGVYRVTTPIINRNTLVSGIEFRGEGWRARNDGGPGVKISWEGTGICWNILTPNGSESRGRWKWKDLAFYSTQNSGTAFQFNDTTIEMTDDNTSPCYIQGVEFEGCYFWGPGHLGNQSITADGIKTLGVFEFRIDESCYFRGWRRAVYCKSADNSSISGRYEFNGRHIMLTTSNFFGNNSQLRPRFLGYNLTSGTETSYKIYDDAGSTTIYPADYEFPAAFCIYLGGTNTMVIKPHFNFGDAQAPYHGTIHVGAGAEEVLIIHPSTTALGSILQLDEPQDWNWRGLNQSFKVVVINPSHRLWLSGWYSQPRMTVIGDYELPRNYHANAVVDSNGESPSKTTVSAFNMERTQNVGGTAMGQPVVESGAFGGYAVRVIPTGSWVMRFSPSYDVQNGQTIRYNIRYRTASPTSGSLDFLAQKSGTNIQQVALAASSTYTTASGYLTIPAVTVGVDDITLGVINTSNANAFISSMVFEVQGASNAKWATAAPTGGRWNQGDIVYNVAPAAAGSIGWVCVASGSPGTWKTFGAISA